MILYNQLAQWFNLPEKGQILLTAVCTSHLNQELYIKAVGTEVSLAGKK